MVLNENHYCSEFGLERNTHDASKGLTQLNNPTHHKVIPSEPCALSFFLQKTNQFYSISSRREGVGGKIRILS